MTNSLSQRISYLIFIATIILYGILIAFSPDRLIYDEIFYIPIAKQSFLHDSALSPEFVATLKAPTGILYSAVHRLFFPITSLELPSSRIVNLLFLAVTYVCMILWIRLSEISFEANAPGKLASCLMLISYPTTGFITCIALTESSSILLVVASMCFLQAGYFICNKSSQAYKLRFAGISSFAISGAVLGLSTLGRQNFILLGVAALPYLIILKRDRIISILVFYTLLLSIFIYPIIIWKGLVPPSMSYVGAGVRVSSFILTLGYISAFSSICFPAILRWRYVPPSLTLLLSAALTTLSVDIVRLGPLRPIIANRIGGLGITVIQLLIAFILTYLSLILLFSLIFHLQNIIARDWKERPDLIFCIAAIALLSISNIKITHQFSIRYITLLIPFVAYLSAFVAANNYRFYARWIASLALSCLPVVSYFYLKA